MFIIKIIINTPGSYISKSGECFLLTTDEKKIEISAKKVEQILITTAAALTTDALLLAVDNNIDVVFLRYNGKPFGRVWHSKLGSISTIRRKQLMLQELPLGLQLTKEWINRKFDNQSNFLKKLLQNRRDEKRRILIKDAVSKIEEFKIKLNSLDKYNNIDEARYIVLGYEGNVGRIYFQTLGQLIPEKHRFTERSRNPAKDQFNCMLNYSYGVLYSQVERACILAGLDPYIGIMHTDNYNRLAFVYDIVEIYRGHMDEIVFKLFSTKKVADEFFDPVEGGVYMNQDGKKLLIEAINKAFETKIKYRGRNIELQNTMQYDCHEIANRILKEVEG